MMNDVVEELIKTQNFSSSLRVLYIEAEDYEDLAMKYGVEVVPTFVFLKVRFVKHRIRFKKYKTIFELKN